MEFAVTSRRATIRRRRPWGVAGGDEVGGSLGLQLGEPHCTKPGLHRAELLPACATQRILKTTIVGVGHNNWSARTVESKNLHSAVYAEVTFNRLNSASWTGIVLGDVVSGCVVVVVVQALNQSQTRQSLPSRDYHIDLRRGGQAERQELLSAVGAGDYNQESSYSSTSMLADIGPSPRTSTSSQAPSSRPILQQGSPPGSSQGHSYSAHHPHSRGLSTSYQHSRLAESADITASMSPLNPPSAPFARDTPSPSSRGSSPGPGRITSSASNIPILGASTSSDSFTRNRYSETGIPGLPTLPSDASNVSLSVNYLPSKFSSGMLNMEGREGPRRRKGKRGTVGGVRMPKMGGGREAFGSTVSRMAGEDDEDEDDEFRMANSSGGVSVANSSGSDQGRRWAFWKSSGHGNTGKAPMSSVPRKKMRWTRFKWILCGCNVLLSLYSVVSLVVCLLTWFDAWTRADIVRVGNRPELVLSTIASLMGLFTSLIGWSGLLMNNRMFLAIYTFLCWITFIFLVIPGYLTYKKRTFNLEGKINAQWSRNLGAEGRMRIQDQLGCCGYYSPYIEATVSQTCYARATLPGCKKHYMEFEDDVLKKWYTAVFSIVPLHIIIMTAGLLCSNHVTYRFGKGMMPKAYRLSLQSMGVIMDQYAQQLAEQYGNDIASEIITRSKSSSQLGAQLDAAPKMPYLSNRPSSAGTSLTKIEPYSNQK